MSARGLTRRRWFAHAAAAIALTACGDATTLLVPGDSRDAATHDAAADPDRPEGGTGDAIASDAGSPTLVAAQSAGVYIPFESLPPRDRSGALVDVTGTDAQDVPGAVGRAIHPATSTLEFAGEGADVGDGDFSIALWIRLVSIAEQPILDKRTEISPGAYRGYFLGVQSTKLVFQMASDTVPIEIHHSAGEVHADCAWHSIVVTVVRGQTFGGRVYFDGKVVRTFVDTDATMTNPAPLRIGSTHFGDKRFLGDIDELVIVNGAVSEASIVAYDAAVRAELAQPGGC